MKRRVECVFPVVGKEVAGAKRVKFSSLDTIHTFADKSVPSPHITVGKPMSQRTEVDKPKTSEYRYFKEWKIFNNQNLTCLESSKSQNEQEGLVASKHFSEVKNRNITGSRVKTKKSLCNQTCISPFLEEQSLEVRTKNSDSHLLENGNLGLVATSSSHCNIDSTSDSMCSQFQTDFKKVHNYGKIFHSKRKKLQELAARALLIEKGDLILYGIKSIKTLLQRLKVLNNSNVGTVSQEEDLECSVCKKDISIGIGNKPIQSNFYPETPISPGLKNDFQKACAPFDILSNAEGLGPTYHGNNLLKIKTSNLQLEDYSPLISSLEADEVIHCDNDSYEYGLHGLADVDLGTHSLCTKQQMTQGIDIDHDNILDTKFLHLPSFIPSRICSNEYDLKWTLEDFPLSTNILQLSRHCVFDSFPVRRDELDLMQWYGINHKSEKFSYMEGINMQVPDHVDKFRCHRQDFCPESGMISWTLPEKNIRFTPLLEHENKHKHYEKESIPRNSVVLWGSSYKDIPNCDKIEDLYFQDTSQNFSLTPSLWDDDDLGYAGPDLGFCFPSIQPHHGTDSWEPKESFSCYLSSEMNLSEFQHKLLNNTDGMHVNKQYSFPYRTRESTDSPVKLHLELENEVNIPEICVTSGEEQDCLEVSIYPVDCGYDSYGAEHVGLNPCTDFPFQSVWKTGLLAE